MPWPLTGATHYHAQLRHPDKGLAIKGLVVWVGMSRDLWDGSLDQCKVQGSGPLMWA